MVTRPLLDHDACARLDAITAGLQVNTAGNRNLLELAWCAELARSIREHPLVVPMISDVSVAVQCTLFEKSKSQNWLVPVHQDLSIPVKEKVEHPDLTGWSRKEGSLFVQPPDSVLQEMVAVRLHIDDCGLEDGPLRIVPGSHKSGRLASATALAERDRSGEVTCPVERGGVLIMKPLLLHASSKASGQSRRRVLHFVYGPPVLPYGLRWRLAV